MTQLINAVVTAAGTVAGSAFQIRGTSGQNILPAAMLAQLSFTYGSGGTSIDVYLQTSIDGGTTWADVVHWAQLTTASLARPMLANVSSIPQTAVAAPAATTDGTQTVNTITQGLFGPLWRVKLVSVGTYAGGTTVRVDAFSSAVIVPATQ